MDSNKDAKVIMSIFAYRDKIRRCAINQGIYDSIETSVVQTPDYYEKTENKYLWITEEYTPKTDLLADLCRSLVLDENVILARYLSTFFASKDRMWITIAMVLTKDINNVIAKYDMHNPNDFKTSRKKQEKPYENMLRVWVKQIREAIEKEEIPFDTIKAHVEALKAEQENDGGWGKTRDKLELILMKKSIKFARLVIIGFEKANGNKRIEDMINESVRTHDLRKELANAYASIAYYIKNKHNFIADLLDKHSDGSECWAAWLMCIAVVHPQEWPKIDEAFKKAHKGNSLSKFITQKMSNDKVLAEAIAVLVDPTFKPTTFTKKLDE